MKLNERTKNLLIGKMREQKIRNLSDDEIIRVFKTCVAPDNCYRGVKRLIKEGFSLQEVWSDE